MCIRLLFAFCCIITFGFANDPLGGSKREVDYVAFFYSVVGEVTEQLCRERQLNVMGGGGGMMDSIYEMAITFNVNYPLTEDRAREILVFAAESYLKKINAHPGVRRSLRNFPFTEKNLSISLINHNVGVVECRPPSVDIAHLRCGKVRFFSGTYDRGQYEYEIEETYQETKAKVAACTTL